MIFYSLDAKVQSTDGIQLFSQFTPQLPFSDENTCHVELLPDLLIGPLIRFYYFP